MQLIPLGRLSLISLMLIGATTLPVFAQNSGSAEPLSEGGAALQVRPDSDGTALSTAPTARVGLVTTTELEEQTRAAIPPENDQALAAPSTLRSRQAREVAQVATDAPAEKDRAAAERKAAAEQRERAAAEAAERAKAEAEKRKAEERERAQKAAAERKERAEKAKAEAEAKKIAEAQAKAEAAAKAKADAEAKAAAEKARQEQIAAERKAKAEAEKAKREQAAAEKKAKEEAEKAAAEERRVAAAKAREEAAAKAKAEAEERARVAAAKKAEEEAKQAAAAAQAKAKAEARKALADALRDAERNLKSGKLDEAQAALAKAKEADSTSARIAPLEKRIASALEAKARREAAAAKREAERATAAATAATALAPLSNDAAVPATIPASVNAVAEADRLAREGRRLLADGNREAALSSFRQAVAFDSTNVEASARLRELEGGAAPGGAEGGVPPLPTAAAPSATGGTVAAIGSAGEPAPAPMAPTAPNFRPSTIGRSVEESQSAFQKGLASYQQGRLDAAVQYWNQSLSLNPANTDAQRYLSQTRAEYEAYVRQNQDAAVRVQRTARASEKLETLVSYSTDGEKSISEFLSAMALTGDISFSVAPGVDPDVRVTAKLESVPLKDALDIVLLPIGLKWNRAGDVVTVTPDLRTKFFNLTGEQVVRLRPLLEKRSLQKFLYGPEGVPLMRSTELLLDESNNTLLVTDSQQNINKVEAFLKDLQTVAPSGLQFKNFKIRPEEGQRIRALVEAVIKTQSDAPYDMERRVVVDRDDLIVKDTAENIAKIEQLLLDKNFLKKIETQKLGVRTFNLAPKEPINENIEQVRELATNIVTVVKTILYAQSTESAAAAEGRRYFYDPNTLQLTITDFPDNLRAVGDYLNSLPQLSGSRRRSEIIYLKHQTASEFAQLLRLILGLSGSGQTTGQGQQGEVTVRSLSTRQEITVGELRIRNVRVQAGQTEDEDDVTLLIRGGTQASQEQTIREFRSIFIEDYEITALDISPSTTPGEGTARLEIRFAPQGQGAQQQQQQGQEQQIIQEPTEDEGISIETVDNLNALLIRYRDSAQLQEIRGWVEGLDTPVLQVSMETKLVEVNESKVKEWMPEFNILDLKKASFGGATGSSRFANNTDQLVGFSPAGRSPFDPYATDMASGLPLMKGSTVLSAVSDSLNFSLRMLEQEGVVNMVNGPHILVENGGRAEFQIEKIFPINMIPNASQTGGNTGGGGQAGEIIRTLRNADLELTPNITQLGEIRLTVDRLDLRDINNIMSETYITNTDLNGDGNLTVTNDPSVQGDAVSNFNNARTFVTRRRSMRTIARVNNGGTIVLGGWNGEVVRTLDAGVPVLRNLPYVGKLLFNRNQDKIDKTNLLIFLTCNIVSP